MPILYGICPSLFPAEDTVFYFSYRLFFFFACNLKDDFVSPAYPGIEKFHNAFSIIGAAFPHDLYITRHLFT